jgi:DNA polymerase III epsilon subunit family exonuclease
MLDLETTGLSPRTDEIIEFGAIKVSLDSNTHPSFHTLVKASRKLPRKIVEITGITQEMVDADGIELNDALKQFISFVGDLPIVTYNAEFDMGFIHNAAKRCGICVENKYACALKRARRAWPGLPSYRLAYISELMSLSDGDQHRALADCQRAVNVFLVSTMKLNQKVRWSSIELA